jgi:hypothetical protein
VARGEQAFEPASEIIPIGRQRSKGINGWNIDLSGDILLVGQMIFLYREVYTMRGESIRIEVHRMVKQAPFRPFVLTMENGDRITIGHPENIAFDAENGSMDYHVISGRIRLFGSFEAITSVATADSVEHLSSP